MSRWVDASNERRLRRKRNRIAVVLLCMVPLVYALSGPRGCVAVGGALVLAVPIHLLAVLLARRAAKALRLVLAVLVGVAAWAALSEPGRLLVAWVATVVAFGGPYFIHAYFSVRSTAR